MDAATRFNEVLDPIVEKAHFTWQHKQHETAQKVNQQMQESIEKLEQENDLLGQQLLALKQDSSQQFEKLKHINKAKRIFLKKNGVDFSFKVNRAITGYAFVPESWDCDNQVNIFTCYYNENCYIQIAISCSGLKDLVEIKPSHPNFLSIRKFFMVNQNVAGLLSSMLTYYKMMEEKQKIAVNDQN